MSIRYRRGFTLIELMITVSIVGILAAVAYPAYTNAVMKGRRAEGRTALTALLQQQERVFSRDGTYRGFSGATDSSNTELKAFSGDNLTASAYTLGAAACPGGTTTLATCVMVFAVPRRTDSLCGSLTMTSVGVVRGNSTGLTVSGNGNSTSTSGTVTTPPTAGCWN